MKLIESGNLKDKGYVARFFLLFPFVEKLEMNTIFGAETKIKQISFPTKICLTSNKNYVRIEIAILGFGIKLEVISRS